MTDESSARSKYAPRPETDRSGRALCLSGGGYRAALFHLGGLRRLNELGVLSQVTTFSSVSGGSILAAFLAAEIARGLAWPPPGGIIPDFHERIAIPFREFTRLNIRTGPILCKLLSPWTWFDSAAGAKGLAGQYHHHLTDLPLRDLPRTPRFILSATDMTFGINWVFDSNYRRPGRPPRGPDLGDYQTGYGPFPDWPLARAVAASSCFPPVFNPLPVGLPAHHFANGAYRGFDRDRLVEGIRLSDGGLYDNMGLEPVWKDHQTLLVSDGGAPFAAEEDRGLLWRVARYTSVQGRQGSAIRKRWLIRNYETGELTGTYWGIGSGVERYRPHLPGYSKALAAEVLATVRTDLDAFTDPESQALQTHGYYLADAAVHTWTADLITTPTPPSMPPPTADDEQTIRRDLGQSHRRKLLGRGRIRW